VKAAGIRAGDSYLYIFIYGKGKQKLNYKRIDLIKKPCDYKEKSMEDKEMSMSKRIIFGVMVAVSLLIFAGCESMGRDIKTTQSEWVGGLDRHISVYSQSGTLLAEYDGRVDIEDSEYGNKVLFDLNGKRTIVYNAVVIIQEK
jgi:hypothetical protein